MGTSTTTAMKHYEFIDHTADVIAKAYGRNLEEAFAAAGEAMFDVITGGAAIESIQTIEMEVESIDLEGLLVTFLSELIVIHEVQEIVLGSLRVEFINDNRLRAIAGGEKFDHRKHGNGVQVKGVSYHMIEIVEGNEQQPSHVQVLFDI